MVIRLLRRKISHCNTSSYIWTFNQIIEKLGYSTDAPKTKNAESLSSEFHNLLFKTDNSFIRINYQFSSADRGDENGP